MIGRSGLFADIMCPYDDDCTRPHCHFWHSKDDISQQQQQSFLPTISAEHPEQQPFVGYVGYVENHKAYNSSTMPIYSQSIYAPLDPIVYSQQPSTSTLHSSTSQPTTSSNVNYIPTKIISKPMRKRTPSPEIIKSSLPVELPVDDILDPANDRRKTIAASHISANSTEVTNFSEMSLNDYAKSVADIDTRIEELQRKIELERRQKEKIVHDIRALVKPSKAITSETVATTKHSSPSSRPKSTYAGGYTPTPIALLKSVEQAKNEARQKKKLKTGENESIAEDANDSKTKIKEEKIKEEKVANVKESVSTKTAKFHRKLKSKEVKPKSVAKKFEEQLSIEDLFEADFQAPPTKKSKYVDNGQKAKSDSINQKVEKQKEMELKMEEVEKRLAYNTGQIRAASTKIRAPTVAQQLMSRYERLQKEKAELLKNLKLKEEEMKAKNIRTAEKEYDYKYGAVAATVGKGEKRTAHIPNVSNPTKVTLAPLEPYSCGKVPYALRSRYLNLFYMECQKFCSSLDDAAAQAQQEEKTIKDRAATKGSYISAAVNVLRRLRDISSPQTNAVKAVSHSAILAGRHHKSITVGQRKYAVLGKDSLNESKFYELLAAKYVLNVQQLEQNGFPLWKDAEKKVVKLKTSELDSKKKLFVEESDLKRICCRCGAEFNLTPKGEYVTMKQCVHHWGKAFKTKTRGLWESRYSCCNSDLTITGCCVADCHVTDTVPRIVLETYRETPPPFGAQDERSKKVYAFDCEMVYTAWGTNLARISMVDFNDKLVMDVIVRPQHKVVDCNTRFSGLTMERIEGAELDLEQTQNRFFELVNSETILIGHSLESDLKAMRIVHHRVVDTSVVFPHRLGPPYKRALKTIASEILQLIIQEDVDGHDSKEDASTCMRLMLHKVIHG